MRAERDDGLAIHEEPFAVFYADASRTLLRDHLEVIGETRDNLETKNIALFQTLADAGALIVTTARFNGRLFGYLVTVLWPSLEAVNRPSATQTVFYASPEFPGLGMRLQRASLEALKARGIKEVFFRAGTRGAGPRTGAIYQRLGAQFDGSTYRLTMSPNDLGYT